MTITKALGHARSGSTRGKWPVVFVGHGTPLNALRDNEFTRAWSALGQSLGQPAGILSISAHWSIVGTAVTAMHQPATLYDFGYPGFGGIKYPTPGSPALASRIASLLSSVRVRKDNTWGLDHGTWSVLSKAFPDASVPVVQLSIDCTREPRFHFELGRCLAPLRDEEVLIMGSGNIVHNLDFVVRHGTSSPYIWASRFDALVRRKLIERDWDSLINYRSLSPDAALAVPTPEHFLPLLYVLGATSPDEELSFLVEGIDAVACQCGQLS